MADEAEPRACADGQQQLGELVGTLDVQQIFKIGAVGKVAGCRVLTGFIRVGCNIRILRENLILYEGKLQSLRSNKDAVDQVDAPNECGMSFDDYQGMEPEDRVEVYKGRDVLDDDEVRSGVEALVRRRIEDTAASPVAGRVLDAAIDNGYHQQLLDAAIIGLARFLGDNRDAFRRRAYLQPLSLLLDVLTVT